MSRVSRKEWYRRVNSTWPAGPLPELTAPEAVSAARRLYRFVRRRKCPWPVKVTSGWRYTQIFGGVVYVNPGDGWKVFIHLLSHSLYRGPHSGEHARGEMRLIKQVIRRGWLAGKLKRTPKPQPVVDWKAQRYERALAARKRWTAKLKLAQTKLRKLNRTIAYYERKEVA